VTVTRHGVSTFFDLLHISAIMISGERNKMEIYEMFGDYLIRTALMFAVLFVLVLIVSKLFKEE
jgi:hypothetical protein